MRFSVIPIVSAVLVFSGTTSSHMLMKSPLSRGYKGNTLYPNIDYDLNAPLPSAVMCKGKPPGPVVQTIRAGETINVQFEGTARHGGGICQFSISYGGDGSQDFVVFQEIIGSCPDENFSWPVTFPGNLPSCERCTFAWTWINAIGNREFYMNCADVRIVGSGSGKIQGRRLLMANFPGYPTLQPRIFPPGGPSSPGNAVNRYPVQRV